MKITTEDLANRNASPARLAMFQKHFGESVELTREVLVSLVSQAFDFDWFVRNFLSREQQEKYDRVRDRARLKYECAVTAKAAELADILLMTNAEWRNYSSAEAQARAEYRRASVEALADALGLD